MPANKQNLPFLCRLIAAPAVLVCLWFAFFLPAAAQTAQVKPVRDGLPMPFNSVVEYDPVARVFYGRIRENGTDMFYAIHRTGKRTRLGQFPTFAGWRRGVSALDREGHRFFYVAARGKNQFAGIMDTHTGQAAPPAGPVQHRDIPQHRYFQRQGIRILGRGLKGEKSWR